MNSKVVDRPVLKLCGQDGNAFFILDKAQRAARAANWPKDRLDKVMAEAQSGDYDNLLGVMMKYFDVD